MKRMVLILVTLLTLLALAACGADPTPTPTSAPAPTATPVPTATPTTAPVQPGATAAPAVATPTPTSATRPTPTPVARTRYETTLFVGGQGSSSYALGIGTAEIVNKNHPWLRIRIVEAQGAEGILTYAHEPDKRPNLLNSFSQLDIGTFLNGAPPLDKPIAPMLAMFVQSPNSSVGIVCADPNIKTLKDTVGKKVALGVPGGAIYNGVEAMMKEAGVWDKINLQVIASSTAQRAAYIDGRIDCTTIGIIDQWTTSSAAQEMQTRGAYLLDHGDAALFKAASARSKLPLEINAVCPAAFRAALKLNYNPVREKVNYIAFTPGYSAAPEVPEDVIYELVKTAWDKRADYRNFHVNGKFMAEGAMPALVLDPAFFHPGARRFYEERGIKYGIDAHLESVAKAKAAGDPKVC